MQEEVCNQKNMPSSVKNKKIKICGVLQNTAVFIAVLLGFENVIMLSYICSTYVYWDHIVTWHSLPQVV